MTAIINLPKALEKRQLHRTDYWSDAEIEWVKENYHKYKLAEMPQFLPTRTPEAVRQKAIELGLSKRKPRVSHVIADISDFTLGYLVGLLEGEGTITVEAGKYRVMSCGAPVLQYTPVVIVSNTNLELLENLRKSLQSGSVKKAVRQIGRKQAYAFRIRGRAPVYSLLQKTMCYLIQKRAVGQAVMRYIETRDPAIVTEIRALNRRVREESYSASYAIFSDSANITSTDT